MSARGEIRLGLRVAHVVVRVQHDRCVTAWRERVEAREVGCLGGWNVLRVVRLATAEVEHAQIAGSLPNPCRDLERVDGARDENVGSLTVADRGGTDG